MATTARGERPRPRVVALGDWSQDVVAEFRKLFPTCEVFATFDHFQKVRVPSEVDVVICAHGVQMGGDWPRSNVHTILFGVADNRFVQYDAPMCLAVYDLSRSEGHDVATVPDVLSAPLKVWLDSFSDARRMPTIGEGWKTPGSRFQFRGTSLEEMSLATSREPHAPLAVHHFNTKTMKGVSWFPSVPPNIVSWVRALLFHWGQWDVVRLPGLRDWHTDFEWMTAEERELSTEIEDLKKKRAELIAAFDGKEAALRDRLLASNASAANGIRRLLTAQGDDLVREVAAVFADFGFVVENRDQTLPAPASKREDLRLSSTTSRDWTAIVEVKGYSASSGKLRDIGQLGNHASYFAVEHSRLPDKQIYVVNGEFETAVSPSLRRKQPFSAEDLAPFEQHGLLVLKTTDLFKLHRDRGRLGSERIVDEIKRQVGLFEVPEDA